MGELLEGLGLEIVGQVIGPLPLQPVLARGIIGRGVADPDVAKSVEDQFTLRPALEVVVEIADLGASEINGPVGRSPLAVFQKNTPVTQPL